MSRSATATVRFRADAAPVRSRQPRPMSRDEIMEIIRDPFPDQSPTIVELLTDYVADLESRSRALCDRQVKDPRSKIRNKDWTSLRHAACRARAVLWDLRQAEAPGPRLMSDD